MRKDTTPSNGIEFIPVAPKPVKGLTITTKPKDSTESPAQKVRTGQGGDKLLNLPYAKLNPNEKRLVDFCRAQGDEAIVTIPQMSTGIYGDLPKERAAHTVRAALRRLVRGDWFAKVKRGQFSLTAIAKTRF